MPITQYGLYDGVVSGIVLLYFNSAQRVGQGAFCVLLDLLNQPHYSFFKGSSTRTALGAVGRNMGFINMKFP
jgi:hypothetical protein